MNEKYYWVDLSKAKFKLLWGYIIIHPVTQEPYISHFLFFSSREDAERFAAAHVDTKFFITDNLSTKLFPIEEE